MARRMVSGRLVALDVVEKGCRAVEINYTDERIEVTGLAEATLPARLEDLAPEVAGRALREALDAAHVSARQAVLTIPRHLAILKPLVLPPMDEKDLPAAVRLQAERELPYSLAEAHIDYAPTGVLLGDEAALAEKAPAGMGLFIGAVQHSVVTARRAFLAAAGLTPRRMGLRPSASTSALVFAGLDTTDEFVALVDLGDQMTEIDIVRSRFLVFSRSAAIGGTASAELPTSEAEEAEARAPAAGLSIFARWQTALVAELRRSLEAFAVQPGGAAVSRLYLTGVNAQDEGLAGAIAEALGIPVATFDPFERTTLVGPLREKPRGELSAFSTALGTAVAECEDLVPGFDFLVPLEERARPVARKRPWAAVAGVLVGLAVLVGAPVGYFQARKAEINRLKGEVTKLEQDDAKLTQLIKQSEALLPWTDERVPWDEAIRALNAAWPDQRRAYLKVLRMQLRPSDQAKVITIDGQAQNPQVVQELTAALQKNPRFTGVDFRGVTVNQADRLGYPIQFQVVFEYRKARPTTTRRAP